MDFIVNTPYLNDTSHHAPWKLKWSSTTWHTNLLQGKSLLFLSYQCNKLFLSSSTSSCWWNRWCEHSASENVYYTLFYTIYTEFPSSINLLVLSEILKIMLCILVLYYGILYIMASYTYVSSAVWFEGTVSAERVTYTAGMYLWGTPNSSIAIIVGHEYHQLLDLIYSTQLQHSNKILGHMTIWIQPIISSSSSVPSSRCCMDPVVPGLTGNLAFRQIPPPQSHSLKSM